MKKKIGFISNSSSSSYVCNVCGDIREGYDEKEVGMIECHHGHFFCDTEKIKRVKRSLCDVSKNQDDDKYEIKRKDNCKICPICQMRTFGDDLLFKALLKFTNFTKAETTKCIKDRFTSYQDFMKWIESDDRPDDQPDDQ
jgi:hypothetical protein